jgi:hypothetical protein
VVPELNLFRQARSRDEVVGVGRIKAGVILASERLKNSFEVVKERRGEG